MNVQHVNSRTLTHDTSREMLSIPQPIILCVVACWQRSLCGSDRFVAQFAKQNPVKNNALSCLNIPSQNVSFIITILIL